MRETYTPKLDPDRKYSYFVMGVSDDNWITFIANKKFKFPTAKPLLIAPGGL